MAKDKYDFIEDILSNKKLSPTQKERVLLLTKNEIKKDEFLGRRLEKRVRVLEEKIKSNRKINSKNELTHDPKLVIQYLKKFKENTALKWTTHPWDEKKYKDIGSFIQALNEDKEHNKLFNIHRDLYNLLSYFIYEPKKAKLKNGIPEFGWPNLRELKIGWQFPNRKLINWCEENFDNKNEADIKYPFQYSLSQELRPKKPVKGKMITTFENVVDVFKTEIQFREGYLYKELKKRNYQMMDYQFDGIEDFKSLDFYTYTPGFLAAIDTILAEIKKNETEKRILFSYKMQENELIVEITHLNSFPTRKLNTKNPIQFIGGGLNAISGSIFSLCDFSIISEFKDENNNPFKSELFLVYYGIKGKKSGKETLINNGPRLCEYKKEIKGFTYKFKFYL